MKKVQVWENERVNRDPDISIITFYWPGHGKIEPGQFIMLESLTVMPRPFTVYDVNGSKVSIVVKNVGKNTVFYIRLKPKVDFIGISGPRGKPIPIDNMEASYILVGGSTGIAGLTLFAKELRRRGHEVDVFLGAKQENEIIGKAIFKKCQCRVETITETGSWRVGLVTDLLQDKLKVDQGQSYVVACGPVMMLHKVFQLCEEYQNECLVLLEEIMSCNATHSCLGCGVRMINEVYEHVCGNGPVFNARELEWKSLIKREAPPPAIKSSPKTKEPMKTVLVGQAGRQLELKNPLMIASGCLGPDAITRKDVDLRKAGAIISKGASLNPIKGNPMPRTCESPAGMLNAIGLQNPGIKVFKKEILPQLQQSGLPIIANIFGCTIDEFGKLADDLSQTNVVALEINVSCPNIKAGGMAFGVDENSTAEVVRIVRKAAPDTFIITKLTPAAIHKIVDIARAAVRSGSDAISAINTIPAMAIDIRTRRPKLGNIGGGLSGPAIKPVAVYCVRQLVQADLGVPIIGVGGIGTAADAAEFFMAGANAIQVGTGSFKNPKVLTEIHDGLIKIMKEHQVTHIQDLVDTLVV